MTTTDYAARVLADSIGPIGVRLTTLEVTLPRIVLAEFNTHRVLSRNSASSRAIPVEKRIAVVREHPFIPDAFGANQRGMQAGDASGVDQDTARAAWLRARDAAVEHASALASAGVHKQWANRLLEPFCWHTIIVSATEWANYFALRLHRDAQPEIRRATECMRDAMEASRPRWLKHGEWHLPLVDPDRDGALSIREQVACSVARCARVSYLTHDGKRDVAADVVLHDRLLTSGHMSPFEHPARVPPPTGLPFGGADDMLSWSGNFRGWTQYRKLIRGENIFVEGRPIESIEIGAL